MAALSRALGGYHIPIDNDAGLKVGREIAVWSWPKYQEYFNGTAKVSTERHRWAGREDRHDGSCSTPMRS